jgi:hypothetical protein
VCKRYGIKSYPTIKVFPGGNKQAFDYKGARETKDIVLFVTNSIGGPSQGSVRPGRPGRPDNKPKPGWKAKPKAPGGWNVNKAKAEAIARKKAAMAAAKGGPNEPGMAARRAAAAAMRAKKGGMSTKWGTAAKQAADAQKFKNAAKKFGSFKPPKLGGWRIPKKFKPPIKKFEL